MGGVAEAEQRRAAPALLRHRERRDPDAAAEQQQRATRRLLEPVAERADEPQLLARRERAEPRGARADRLEHERERPVTRCARDRDGATEQRPLALTAAPTLDGGEHVELPGQRRGAVVCDVDQRVGTQARAREDGGAPAAERRAHPR